MTDYDAVSATLPGWNQSSTTIKNSVATPVGSTGSDWITTNTITTGGSTGSSWTGCGISDSSFPPNSIVTNTGTVYTFNPNTVTTTPGKPIGKVVSKETVDGSFTFTAKINEISDDFWKKIAGNLDDYILKGEKKEPMKNNKMIKPINITTKKSNSAKIYISDVEILVPNKVVKVTIERPLMAEREFSYKQVCKDPDTFDLRFAIALGIVKHFEKVEQAFPHPLTNYGREVKAREFCDIYDTTSRAIDQAIRAMKKKEAAKERFEKEKAEAKAIKERRREKNRKKREKRREKLQLVRLVKE